MNYNPNQNGKVLEERLAGFNSGDMKTTLRLEPTLFQNDLPSFAISSKISPHSCHFITHNRE